MGAVEFWKWLRGSSRRLERMLNEESPDTSVVAEVDRALRSIFPLRWEFGPNQASDGYVFALAPGTADELRAAREVVACAEPIKGWTLLASRPAKPWLKRTTILVGEGSVEFVFSEWEYEVQGYDDARTFDVYVRLEEPNSVGGRSIRDLERAAQQAIRLMLGDLAVITCIDDVQWAPDKVVDPTELTYIGRHLKAVVHDELAGCFRDFE